MSEVGSLIQRSREGDILAVQSLLQEYQRPLYRLAYALLLNATEAILAVQDGLLSAIYTPARKRNDESETTWLNASVAHAAAGRMPKQIAVEQVPELSNGETSNQASDTRLWRSFLQLPPEQRLPLTLHYFFQYPLDECARVLRLPKNTVKVRLSSGRDRLLVLLQDLSASTAQESAQAAGGVSHTQAQMLLQSAADEELPAHEWVMLQAHLDHCELCRAYRQRLKLLERDLTRTLRAHLEAQESFIPINPEKLLERQRRGLKIRSVAARTWKSIFTLLTIGIGFFLVYAIFLPTQIIPNLLYTPTPTERSGITRTPQPTVTATPPIDVPFRAPVVYQSTRDGNSEIYLIDPAGGAINLTNDPARDYAPVWSADGEWIAFLSDRSGRSEIYVMRVSGTQLLQLTAEPDIEWQPPLSWSPDGKRIALSGNQGGKTWIYLVGVGDDAQVVRWSNSQGGLSPRWSADGKWLAYQKLESRGLTLMAGATTTGGTFTLVGGSWVINGGGETLSDRSPEQGFDWSPQNNGIIYIVEGSQMSRPSSASRITGESSSIYQSSYMSAAGLAGSSGVIIDLPIEAPISGLSASPKNVIAMAQMDAGLKCEQLPALLLFDRPPQNDIYSPSANAPQTDPIPGVCLRGAFSDQAWTADGRWLVFEGQETGINPPRLFALDVVKARHDLIIDAQARLPMIPLVPDDPSATVPQVQPAGDLLDIRPQAVSMEDRASALPRADFTIAQGEIILTLPQGANNYEVFGLKPNGSGRKNLTNNLFNDQLAAISPAGRIAFFSDRFTGAENMRSSNVSRELFLMEADGSHPVQLTGSANDPRRSIVPMSTSRVVWSPDDNFLAMVIFSENGQYLMTMPNILLLPQEEIRYTPLPAGNYTQPVWRAGGTQVAVGNKESNEIWWIDAATGDKTSTVQFNDGQILDLAGSADGSAPRALLGFAESDNKLELLMWMTRSDQLANDDIVIGNYSLPVSLTAVPGRRYFLFRNDQAADAKYKTTFDLLDTQTNTDIKDVFLSEASVYAYCVSPDGKWLLYSTEEGLWALDIEKAIAKEAGPTRIIANASQPIITFGWRP